MTDQPRRRRGPKPTRTITDQREYKRQDMANRRADPEVRQRQQQVAQARKAAIDRLIEAHPDEFAALLRAERDARGIQDREYATGEAYRAARRRVA